MAEEKKKRFRAPKNIDYEKEFLEKTRCPQCKRATNPETDYVRNGLIKKETRTCIKCRTSVLNSINRTLEKNKKMTLHQKKDVYEKIVKSIPNEQLAALIAELGVVLPADE